VKRLKEAVGQHACFLDTLRLKATHPVRTNGRDVPVLSMIHDLAREHGIAFVPVLPVTAQVTVGHRRLVRDTVITDGRGVALRYPMLRAVVLDTHAAALSAALADLNVDVSSADLLIDVGWLSPDKDIQIEDVVEAVDDMRSVGHWRSMVLIGTSMPSQLGGSVPEGTVTALPRLEWNVWSELRSLNLPRQVTYGDYGIQHPTPPHEPGGPGMRANIRYTDDLVTFIARGRGPFVQEGKAQYRTLCQQLVQLEQFKGRGYSWGDDVIFDCAHGHIEPGAQDLWRGAGTSHHLRLVTEQLSML
jgi:hypothetical protein